MAKVILTSVGTLWNAGENKFYDGVPEMLSQLKANKIAIAVVSNKAKPAWLNNPALANVIFQVAPKRQSGEIVGELCAANIKNGFKQSDFIILGSSDVDFQMAVNSKTLLIRADWATKGTRISGYGIGFKLPTTIQKVITLLGDVAPWYFRSESPFIDYLSLTNAGTYLESNSDTIRLIGALRACLKDGNTQKMKAFLLHFLSSVYATDGLKDVKWWSYYPSSSSKNDESEIMASFCNLARTTFKRTTKGPLFIRHKPTEKRHQAGGDRTDPKSQIESIIINPAYRDQLRGTTVAVLDDFLTYGASFGVAASLLKKEGVRKVICISMGKFSDLANTYDIHYGSEVFAPISNFKVVSRSKLQGKIEKQAQLDFVSKFAKIE